MDVRELGVKLAAGGLLWRDAETCEEIAVIYRERYDDWSLPKGKLDPARDDDWVDTAVREVREETGCEVELREFADCISYLVDDTPKVVLFWIACCTVSSVVQTCLTAVTTGRNSHFH